LKNRLTTLASGQFFLAPSPALCSISFSVVEGIVVADLSAKHMKLTVHPPCFDFSETFNFVLAFLPLLDFCLDTVQIKVFSLSVYQ
jgi:hypothetical protein